VREARGRAPALRRIIWRLRDLVLQTRAQQAETAGHVRASAKARQRAAHDAGQDDRNLRNDVIAEWCATLNAKWSAWQQGGVIQQALENGDTRPSLAALNGLTPTERDQVLATIRRLTRKQLANIIKTSPKSAT
jgi:hypothetical protein